MAPVALQQLVSTAFGVVDGVMVGGLGQISIDAVTVANKPALLFNGLFFGLTGGAGILLSQYYGAGDRATCRAIFSLELVIGLAMALACCLAMWLVPGPIMGLFTGDAATIALG
ncbi:MAG: MATE family efflux transporter, partial [Clostridiales bacterium]|nr:MATE family efflux transporter [Clostridiales bacterium]